MESVDRHPHTPDASFDGGDLDCGSGLLLLIRRHIDPLDRGGLLEVRSTEPSVEEDLPAWCRLTGNELISWTQHDRQRSFLICKGRLIERSQTVNAGTLALATAQPQTVAPRLATSRSDPAPAPAPNLPDLAVMGVGSWPRPVWLLRALQERLRGRLSEEEFQTTADDAVRLCVDAQRRAGADVITDGEQRRNDYASFVGGLLDNCQLIPLTDLLPLVEHPEEFEAQLQGLGIPGDRVRHPAVFGRLARREPLALRELRFLKSLAHGPIKVALPGPYLLTRTMWLECMAEKAYATREDLAEDIVRILQEELRDLLAEGAALVQFDEPVLTEVVFSLPVARRTFMCGALSAKGEQMRELAFAQELINRVVQAGPRERTAVHVCRGNWTADEDAVLSGSYRPLLPLFQRLNVGAILLEFCTPRAGDLDDVEGIPDDVRVGIGVVNPKDPRVEPVDAIVDKGRRAIRRFGKDRVFLTPDCGFATFADAPIANAAIAEGKLQAIARAVEILKRE
jgi:5-methyltetrahydropteroyltriglutamate--homocysteine methyltransferase